MGQGKHRLAKYIGDLERRKTDRKAVLSGLLGLPINGQRQVEVPGRLGYVYVRLRDNQSEVIQAYNDKVSPVYDLPVLVQRDEIRTSQYRIIDRDIARYSTWGSAYLPRHGNQHSFTNDIDGGGDVVWVYGRQFLPLACTPSGTLGGPNAILQFGTYYYANGWRSAGGTGTPDLVGYKPTDGTAKLVLLYIDQNSNPALVEGNSFSVTLTGTSQITSYIPSLPATNGIPIAAIRLVSGTSTIGWDNIYDLRPMIVGDGFIPTGTGKQIQDEGVDVPDQAKLNFIGTQVWAVDDAANHRTNVIISGTPRHIILDEGIPLADRSKLDFVGANVWVSDNAGAGSTQVIISGSSGHAIQDEGIAVTNRANLNFVGLNTWVVDDAGNNATKVIISGSGPHVIQDEGTTVIARTKLNFIGALVWVQDDAGNNATKVIISGSASSGHTIQDEGTPLATRTNLNFVGPFVYAQDDAGSNATKIIVSGTPSHRITSNGIPVTDYPKLNFGGRLFAEADAEKDSISIGASGTSFERNNLRYHPRNVFFLGSNIWFNSVDANNLQIILSGSASSTYVSGTFAPGEVLFGQSDTLAGTRSDFAMITTNGPTLAVGGIVGSEPFVDEYLIAAIDPDGSRGGNYAGWTYGSQVRFDAYGANGTKDSPSQSPNGATVFTLATYARSDASSWLYQGYLSVKVREDVSTSTRGGGYWEFVMPAMGSAVLSRTILDLRYEEARVGANLHVSGTAYLGGLDVSSDLMRLRTAKTPANASDTGALGQICWDSGFLYVCVATNTWKRAAIASW